jgi:hypothetical protein
LLPIKLFTRKDRHAALPNASLFGRKPVRSSVWLSAPWTWVKGFPPVSHADATTKTVDTFVVLFTALITLISFWILIRSVIKYAPFRRTCQTSSAFSRSSIVIGNRRA